MNQADLSLSADELRVLLQREEGQFLEFKSLWDLSGPKPKILGRRKVRDMIVENVAAFANADAGTLILGADDYGSPSGHGYSDEVIAGFFAAPGERLRPIASCRAGRVTLDGHELLVFEVPMAPEAVMVVGNGFPYRTGDQVIREPQEVINARKAAYRRIGYEPRFRPDAALEDLDQALIARFLAGTPFRGRSPEEVLALFGLIQAKAEGWGITNAALLLFGRPPLARWHPRMGIRFFRVDGTERLHGKHRNVTQGLRIELPLAEAIAEAHRYGREQIRRSEKLHDLFFKEMPEYPGFAWQEAIVNAVAHRDYEDQSREIEVWFYDDRMEVLSPGDLIPPVTLEALQERRPVHASRNPLIVRILVEAGLMREEGEGIPRIFEEMADSFLRPPALDVRDGVFSVCLFNEPIFSGPSPEWQKLVNDLPIVESQKTVLLANPDGFTNEDFRKLSQVDRDEAYRQIQEMVTLGILVGTEKRGRGAVYRIAQDILRTRKFLERRMPALRRFFSENDRLTNADYRGLFELSRYGASRELRRLVDEDFLRLEGEKRGTHYLPLPALGVERK